MYIRMVRTYITVTCRSNCNGNLQLLKVVVMEIDYVHGAMIVMVMVFDS